MFVLCAIFFLVMEDTTDSYVLILLFSVTMAINEPGPLLSKQVLIIGTRGVLLSGPQQGITGKTGRKSAIRWGALSRNMSREMPAAIPGSNVGSGNGYGRRPKPSGDAPAKSLS